MNKGRETWLDSLKGFGALLVVLGHVLSGYLDAGTFPEAYSGMHQVRTWIYSFHMPLFFLISGFTFTLAYYRDGKLRRDGFGRQLWNLAWVYVLFALLQWGIKQLVPGLVNETYTLEDLKTMLWVPLGNFWYVYVLFLLYLVAAITGMPRRSPLWLLPLGAVAVYVASIHLDWTQLTLYRILYHLFFFGVGSGLCVHRRVLTSPKAVGLASMLLGTAAFFYFFRYTRNWYAIWRVLIALSTSFVNVYLFHRFSALGTCPALRFCGKYALELYLLHTFFTGGLRTLLPLVGITGALASVVVNFVVSTGVSLGLGVLLSRYAGWIFRPSRLLARRRSS
jgi:fucose 4-O-acetylase-like acetyltransferase